MERLGRAGTGDQCMTFEAEIAGAEERNARPSRKARERSFAMHGTRSIRGTVHAKVEELKAKLHQEQGAREARLVGWEGFPHGHRCSHLRMWLTRSRGPRRRSVSDGGPILVTDRGRRR